jgi:iron complex outermembrane receptor protein
MLEMLDMAETSWYFVNLSYRLFYRFTTPKRPGDTMSTSRRTTDRRYNVLAAAVFCALMSMQASAADSTATAAAADELVAATTADADAVAADETSAQDPAAAASTDPARIARLRTVTVTAQKREQAAIDVPASVTALDAKRLTEAGATQLEDYSAQIPGMSITTNGGSMQVTLRGISTGLSQAAPTTAVYIDEAPIGSVNSFAVGSGLVPDIDPADLQQIEVLKGPQGTIFGGGAMGGVLRYVTRAPSFNKYSGSVTLGASEVAHGGNGSLGRFSLNLSSSDDFAVRVSGFQRNDPGYIDNPIGSAYGLPTEDVNEVTTSGGRIAMAWRISDTWRLDAFALTQRRDGDGGTWVDVDRNTLEPVYGDNTHPTVVSEQGNVKLDVFNATFHGQFGTFGFVSSTTWQQNQAEAFGDSTGSFGLLLGLLTGDFTWGVQSHQKVNTKRISQEFRLENNAFDDKLYYSLGLFYTEEDNQNRIPSFPTISLITGEPKVIYIPGTNIPFPDQLVKAQIDTTYEELSFFANATYTFNDKFDLQGGIRFGRDEQHYDQLYSGLLFFPPVALIQDSENDKFQYLITGRYHPTDNDSFYARLATGYRPGGPSAATPNIPFPSVVDSDSLTSIEAGWKTVRWDDKLSFEAAIFHTDWEDIQIQTSLSGTQFFVNGGKATSQGWEATLGLYPVAGLNIRGSIGYTDAALTEDTSNVMVAPGVPLGADGDQLPFVPEWTSSLLADYTWVLSGDWTASIGGSINYVGDRQSDYSGRGGVEVPSYTLYNANFTLRNANWQFSLYGKNLNDSNGILYLTDRGLGALTPSAPLAAGMLIPRTFGLNVTYSF